MSCHSLQNFYLLLQILAHYLKYLSLPQTSLLTTAVSVKAVTSGGGCLPNEMNYILWSDFEINNILIIR